MKKTKKQIIRGWGTILDYRDRVPSKYIGKSFQQAWHDDIEAFKNMTDDEKWEMGFWVEHRAIKKSFKYGLFFGFLLAILILLIIF